MSYWIDEPYKSSKNGSLLWAKDNFEVYGNPTRFSIYLNDYCLGELINGYETLNKRYKNSFDCWISFLKNKDLTKVNHTRDLIKEASNTCDFIENLWNNI